MKAEITISPISNIRLRSSCDENGSEDDGMCPAGKCPEPSVDGASYMAEEGWKQEHWPNDYADTHFDYSNLVQYRTCIRRMLSFTPWWSDQSHPKWCLLTGWICTETIGPNNCLHTRFTRLAAFPKNTNARSELTEARSWTLTKIRSFVLVLMKAVKS